MPETESRLIKRRKFKNRSRWFVFIIAAVTVLFAVYPTLGGQVVSNGTEMRYTLLRIESICEGWSNGYFPVRVNPIFFDNYGYGASLTSPDLFLWFPAFLRRLGMGLTDAYNIFICFCTVFCWCASYKAGKDITRSRYGGMVSAVIVVLSQYYANTLFYRASYEDYLSFIFIPVAVLGLYDIFYREYKKPWIYFFGMLGLFCSSVRLFAMMFILSLVLFCIYAPVFRKRPRFILVLLVSFVLIAALTCAFWLPYIEQSKYIDLTERTEINWTNSSVGINRLIANTQAVSDGSVMTASFGSVLILLTLLRFFVRKKDDAGKLLPLADRLMFLGYVCLFLSSSLFPIKFWWVLKFIGYPARFYIFAVIFFAISVAIVMHIGLKGRKMRSIALYSIIAVSILVAFAEADARNISYISFSNGYFKNDPNRTYQISSTSLIPANTEYDDFYKGNSVFFDDGSERYITARDGTSIEFDVDGEEKYADLPLLYYYGYTAEILDGEGSLTPVRIDGEGENNVCRVYLSKVGKGTVRVWYKPTSMQNLSLVVTAGSLVACAGVFGIYYNRKKQKGFNDGNAI